MQACVCSYFSFFRLRELVCFTSHKLDRVESQVESNQLLQFLLQYSTDLRRLFNASKLPSAWHLGFLRFLSTILKNLAESCLPCQKCLPCPEMSKIQENFLARKGRCQALGTLNCALRRKIDMQSQGRQRMKFGSNHGFGGIVKIHLGALNQINLFTYPSNSSKLPNDKKCRNLGVWKF